MRTWYRYLHSLRVRLAKYKIWTPVKLNLFLCTYTLKSLYSCKGILHKFSLVLTKTLRPEYFFLGRGGKMVFKKYQYGNIACSKILF